MRVLLLLLLCSTPAAAQSGFPQEAGELLTRMLRISVDPAYRGPSDFSPEWFEHQGLRSRTELDGTSEGGVQLRSYGEFESSWGVTLIIDPSAGETLTVSISTQSSVSEVEKVLDQLAEPFTLSEIDGDYLILCSTGVAPLAGVASVHAENTQLFKSRLRVDLYQTRHSLGDRILADAIFQVLQEPNRPLEEIAKACGLEKRGDYYAVRFGVASNWELRLRKHRKIIYVGVRSEHFDKKAISLLLHQRSELGCSPFITKRLEDAPVPYVIGIKGATMIGSIALAPRLAGQIEELEESLWGFSGVSIKCAEEPGK